MVFRHIQSGFTLIELLVVIAIIGLLATIGVVSMSESRMEARNAQVLSQMFEYQKALELYFAEFGEYPTGHGNGFRTNVLLREQVWCIGDGARPGACLPFSQAGNLPGYPSDVEVSLAPTFISQIVHIDQPSASVSSPAYRGCGDLFTGLVVPGDPSADEDCGTDAYSIFFALEGTNQDCGRAHTVSADYNAQGFTVCQLSSAQ